MSKLQRFLRRRDVETLTGLGESSIYAEMAKGKFPKPIKLSSNRVAWLEDDIAAWQAERLAQRDQAAA